MAMSEFQTIGPATEKPVDQTRDEQLQAAAGRTQMLRMGNSKIGMQQSIMAVM